MPSGVRSGKFRAVKIALIIFQALALIGAAVLLILSIAALALVDSDQHRSQHPENIKATLIVVIVASAITLVVEIVGLVGAVKENQSLTLVFGVLMALSTICNFATVQILPAIINLIVTTLAFMFAYLIGKEAAAPVQINGFSQ